MSTQDTNTNVPAVTVVGGGLAGLTAALELIECGFSVTLYEASDHLGGKAGSIRDGRVYDGAMQPVYDQIANSIPSDHGYHVFPRWYVNMRRLWTRVGITPQQVFEGGDYYQLSRGTGYDFKPPRPRQEREAFSVMDLVTRTDAEVNDLSFRGFLYSRCYNGLESVSLRALFLNALSIEEYDISSRVVRNLFCQWYPVLKEKNWAALKGSLDEILIAPMESTIRRRAEEKGLQFQLHYHHRLTKITAEDAPMAIEITDNKGSTRIIDRGPVVLAVPLEVLRSLQSDTLFAAEPALANLSYLRAHQFGAIDIYFKHKLPKVPQDHFDLLGSTYSLSAFDISQHWDSLSGYPGTVLQFVAGNCRRLQGLSEVGFMHALVREIREYLPAARASEMAFLVPHPNADQPLFVNDVGTWELRPQTQGEQFYFAGDFVQNDTDITSMEGAVRSGMNAAEAIRQRYAPHVKPVVILPPVAIPEEQLMRLRSEQVGPGRIMTFMKYRLPELLDGM
ncbi:FAD-dependent oxidoreductase [Exilibacterium tricleocarpae]|uniref:FAD-dependent oxidoreductase n=1 Tax=Exilibacterium tricleocarpae TaxID=2591008 RepID=A0A545TUX4_9GAMM|nr:FAD-dependent oxidoreductase [Exilibacterium tricleocarpae]TQV81017.1 FAD-dependent oxidoreductase [Exilibacterium tricleocarpae]